MTTFSRVITYTIAFALCLAIASIISSLETHQPSLNQILGMPLNVCNSY
jgi:hypothetical protein